MKSMRYLTTGVSALALVAAASICTSATALAHHHQLIPLGVQGHIGPYLPPYVAPAKSKSGKWTDLKNLPTFSGGPDVMLMRTDASVFVYDGCAGQWWTLTPDKKGKYATGKWSSKASVMPSGYSPLFFASQILPDGRMIMNGGEYNNTSGCNSVWTNKGALYDPVANSWTTVAPPTGWASIGDAQSIVLPDGSYMLAECCGEQQAIATISGTTVTWTTTGSGKADDDDEEGYTALPGGDVLTVDVWKVTSDSDNWELYDPSTGAWTSEGSTPDLLTTTKYRELGPAVLSPAGGGSGTVFQFTANSASGVNDIYNVATQTWTSGPVMKVNGTIYDDADAPGVLLPDGNALTMASPGTYLSPSHFWEFKVTKTGGVTATQVNDTETAASDSSYIGHFLELPTGQVLWNNSGEIQGVTPEIATYTPKGMPKAAWLPAVSSVSSKLKVGSSANAISGTNFNGFSLGASYGDDAQMATNWPLVRITNTATGDVCFGRSYNFSTMGVWTSGTTNAVFDIPKRCETGASTLQAIVNGLASPGVKVTLS
jgi:hypothetical protein